LTYNQKLQNEKINEKAFYELTNFRLYPKFLKKNLEKRFKKIAKHLIGLKIEYFLYRQWEKETRFSDIIEKKWLPRRAVEHYHGDVLKLEVNPLTLTELTDFKNKKERRYKERHFIWDGDWDIETTTFKNTFRFRLLSDIWRHRENLKQSEYYQEFTEMLKERTPYKSYNTYHRGVYLDSEEKIYKFLQIYLIFMKQMQEFGYDETLTNDPLYVAVTRNGALLKTVKGLHRLAMAQIVGLDKIPVRIMGIHRIWWDANTKGLKRQKDRIPKALEHLITKR